MSELPLRLPLKSVAGALLFSMFFGPVGLLYSTVIGGAILIFFEFLMLANGYFPSAALIWLISCVCSVAAVNRYNKKVIKNNNIN